MTETVASLSENVQMYLVAIARSREGNQPVPLSQLAEEFSISSSAVNEMCRKLEKEGYLTYQPYKGVLLTPRGEEKAYYILRRHRLWEVFLVEKLNYNYEDAHGTACQLEHSTSRALADHLAIFLGHPKVNPQGAPIPSGMGSIESIEQAPLTSFPVEQRVHVLRCEELETTQAFLAEQGIRPGSVLVIKAVTDSSLLLQIGDQRVILANSLAENIIVEPDN
ncbi:MAG: metal-dependent transcriptional regulator [Chloroflexota bacterium]|nr:MAG: metal-dependent transcriptional regulator [Chloroflexota bacterium]